MKKDAASSQTPGLHEIQMWVLLNPFSANAGLWARSAASIKGAPSLQRAGTKEAEITYNLNDSAYLSMNSWSISALAMKDFDRIVGSCLHSRNCYGRQLVVCMLSPCCLVSRNTTMARMAQSPLSAPPGKVGLHSSTVPMRSSGRSLWSLFLLFVHRLPGIRLT